MKKKKSYKNIFVTIGILILFFLIVVGVLSGVQYLGKINVDVGIGHITLIITGIIAGIIFLILEIRTIQSKQTMEGEDIYYFSDFLFANFKYLCISIMGGVSSTIIVLGWYNIIKNIKSIWLDFLNSLNYFFPNMLKFVKYLSKEISWLVTNKWVWIVVLSIGGFILVKYILYKVFIKR